MEIAKYIQKAAEKHLQFEGDKNLPAQLANTEMYLAEINDDTVVAHGAISFSGIEYKIGTKKFSS